MRILELKAARGWSTSQAARVFGVTEETIATWIRRIDEGGDRAPVQASEPINKFPAFVGYLVRRLKATCPSMGKVRIAQALARAGLHLGATTVRRMLREKPDPDVSIAAGVVAEGPRSAATGAVRANRPDHIWHLDLTVVPTGAGFWVPWLPFSKVQRWPFCWWVVVALDQFSRQVIGFAVFTKMPTSPDVCRFLDDLTHRRSACPKYVITDKGTQFFCETFRSWCRERGIGPRFGAVGKQASVAVIERFMRSLKAECIRHVQVPFCLEGMREELACYVYWYNEHRPHQGWGGLTPAEIYVGSSPSPIPRFEPRASRDRRNTDLRLVVSFVEGRRHLPIVELARAA